MKNEVVKRSWMVKIPFLFTMFIEGVGGWLLMQPYRRTLNLHYWSRDHLEYDTHLTGHEVGKKMLA
jgi:hypothetical protein